MSTLRFLNGIVFVGTFVVTSICAASQLPADEKPIRLGIIGLDTSHVIHFTRILNDTESEDHVAGARVVAAFKGGSPDVEASATRVDKFTQQLKQEFGVEIVPDIPTLCSKVDGILLESVDGRPHLEQLRPVIAARKPVFIDKPLAGSWEDCQAIVRLVKESGVPCFSSSSLRYYPSLVALQNDGEIGDILGCEAFSPAYKEPHHPDLYWYGVHGVEILFTLMGPGCKQVSRVATPDCDVVVGVWDDGRVGTYRGLRKGRMAYGARVFGTKAIKGSDGFSGNYRPLVQEIVKFFRTGVAPVSMDETLELFAFMSAADESRRRNGAVVKLSELMTR